MMAEPSQAPPLTVLPENIPAELRALDRWAPWAGPWNERRGKNDKIPRRVDAPHLGLSTRKPEQWFKFDAAVGALRRHHNTLAGIGLCVTGLEGYTLVDLDRCTRVRQDGVRDIDTWALEVIQTLNSYCEVSPYGHGLRIIVRGTVPYDWVNHEVGIEVYGGNDARFLTITGQPLTGVLGALNRIGTAPPGSLERLAAQYAKERTKATVLELDMPDVLSQDELELLGLAIGDLEGLSPSSRDFLVDGACWHGDRSRALFAATNDLYSLALPDQQVLSILVASEHAMDVARSHRRNDDDRALQFLWQHQCLKAKAKAAPKVATAADFEDVAEPATSSPAADATPQGDPPPAPVQSPTYKRTDFIPVGDWLDRGADTQWRIKGWLPDGGVAAIAGPSSAGKSFVALDMSMSIARGVEWAGCKTEQASVAYVLAEGAGGFRKRVRAYFAHHGISKEAAHIPLNILDGAPDFRDKEKGIKPLVEALKACRGGAPKVIVVDTLARVMVGADENSAQDMGVVMQHCSLLATVFKASVLLVAHTGKDDDKGLRGSSAIRAALDTVIMVSRDSKHPERRLVRLEKAKDGEDNARYPFALEQVWLGDDDDGDSITSCVVIPREDEVGHAGGAGQPDKAPRVGLGKWGKAVLEFIAANSDLSPTEPSGPTMDALLDHLVKLRVDAGSTRKLSLLRWDAKDSVESLIDKGLVVETPQGLRLTEQGSAICK